MNDDDEEHLGSPTKRRRISRSGVDSSTHVFKQPANGDFNDYDACSPMAQDIGTKTQGDPDAIMSLSAATRLAGQTVAPFLAKHIPEQYAPLGGIDKPKDSPVNPNLSTKYCYRHRPDLKCRRQADEPSMDQLQHELEALSHADQQGIAHVWSVFSAAPAKHRKLILQGILTQCCFPQLSYLSSSVRDLIRIDFLSALPPEISFKILCYLDTASLCKAAQVSQRWRTLADDDVVWHKMCEQHIDRKCTKCGWGLPLLERKKLRASKRQIQLRATRIGLNVWSPNITPFPERASKSSDLGVNKDGDNLSPSSIFNKAHSPPTPNDLAKAIESIDKPQLGISKKRGHDDLDLQQRTRPWKDVYKDRFKIGTNWKYGRCSTKVFKGHSNGVMCLQFNESILATGSYDTTIKIWDIESGETIRTLTGHESGIRCLQFDDMKLISGSIDRNIKIWNWRTGECLSTYLGHTGGIVGLHFDSTLLASGSMDNTIKIWNFEDKSTFVLRGHTDWVNAVKLDSASRTVFSASDDCTVGLWDLDTRVCIKSFEGHVGQVQQVLPLPPEFDFDEDDAEIPDGISSSTSSHSPNPCIHNNNLAPNESYGPGFAASNRPLPPRYMLTGALDSTVRLWDTATQTCLRTYFGHVEGIWGLAADTLRLVSGSEDRTVKVWDTRSGRCERTFTGHAGPVTCIGLSDNRMVTGSEDCEVRMYTF